MRQKQDNIDSTSVLHGKCFNVCGKCITRQTKGLKLRKSIKPDCFSSTSQFSSEYPSVHCKVEYFQEVSDGNFHISFSEIT